MERYRQLVELIKEHKPKTIVEIGVHRGARSAAMMKEAIQHSHASYIGYDVFDTKDKAFHEKAFNKKGQATELQARTTIKNAGVPLDSCKFVVGDTSETLHGQDVVADFVFIDGDHRVEVIAGDFEAVRNSKVIVFDDYYTGGPDTSTVGCNEVVEKHEYVILPVKDGIAGGGYAQLVVITHD